MEIKEAKQWLNIMLDEQRRGAKAFPESNSCMRAESIETVLAELEKYKNKIILTDEEYRKVIDEAQKDSVPNDKIREKIDNQISIVEKLLDEIVDKDIGCINTSYLSKKEKEEVITKRNCLIVQKATLEDIKIDLLKEEKEK